MNQKTIQRYLTPGILGLGFLGLGLRLLLPELAEDEKGLLIPWHPLILGLLGLTLAAAVLSALAWDRPRGRSSRREALGAFAGALGIGLAFPGILSGSAQPLDGICLGLCVVAAGALALDGVLRWLGRPGSMLCCCAVCLFLAIFLVCRYRSWSAQPQLLHYLYPLLGALGMMLFSYLRCVPGRIRLRRTVALAGAFCCLVSAELTGFGPMFLGGAAWLLAQQDAPGEE